MSVGESLPAEVEQKLKLILKNCIDAQSKQIKELLDSFAKNEAKYSRAFLKHIPDGDTSLRSKYELICDLRNGAIDELKTEIVQAMHVQTVAIQRSLVPIKESTAESTDSNSEMIADLEYSSEPIILESNQHRQEEQSVELIVKRNEKVVDHQKEAHRNEYGDDSTDARKSTGSEHWSEGRSVPSLETEFLSGWRRPKWKGSHPNYQSHRHEMKYLAQRYRSLSEHQMYDMFEKHFGRSIRETFNGTQFKKVCAEFFRTKCCQQSNQWIAISRIFPNVSGYWTYRSDPRYKIVLKEYPATGQVVGFTVFNNQKDLTIEGQRIERVQDGQGSEAQKVLYQFTKVHPDGKRVDYSVTLDPEADTINIIKNGTSRAKIAKLHCRRVPPKFQGELARLKMSRKSPQSSGTEKRTSSKSSGTFAFHEKRAGTMDGLWKGEKGSSLENVQYILFEDFANGMIIGFTRQGRVTKSTINGWKNPEGMSQIIERMHDTQQQIQYEVTLLPNKQTIEMRKSGDPIGAIPYKLQLMEKRLPNTLFNKLERLKNVEDYEGKRFLYLDD